MAINDFWCDTLAATAKSGHAVTSTLTVFTSGSELVQAGISMATDTSGIAAVGYCTIQSVEIPGVGSVDLSFADTTVQFVLDSVTFLVFAELGQGYGSSKYSSYATAFLTTSS
jgi:hypothetical protein